MFWRGVRGYGSGGAILTLRLERFLLIHEAIETPKWEELKRLRLIFQRRTLMIHMRNLVLIFAIKSSENVTKRVIRRTLAV